MVLVEGIPFISTSSIGEGAGGHGFGSPPFHVFLRLLVIVSTGTARIRDRTSRDTTSITSGSDKVSVSDTEDCTRSVSRSVAADGPLKTKEQHGC